MTKIHVFDRKEFTDALCSHAVFEKSMAYLPTRFNTDWRRRAVAGYAAFASRVVTTRWAAPLIDVSERWTTKSARPIEYTADRGIRHAIP